MLTDQSLKEVLQKMTTSGRMVKWNIELSEYSLEFRPRKSIKAQALAEFVAECTFRKHQKIQHQSAPEGSDQLAEMNKPTDIWSVQVNGSSTQESARTGILLIGPNKEEFKCFIKFTFPITNNATEYEALLAGLRLVRRIRADTVKIFVDSQLVVQEVTGNMK